MNGVHDMGGMQGYGPVAPESDEPTFHAAWERRAFALVLAMGGTGAWNLDQSRAARESLPPAQYLASSYYRIWLDGLCKLLLERTLVTAEELADGRMRTARGEVPRVLQAERVADTLARGSSTLRSIPGHARFAAGDRVRTRNLNPATHTRLPRYCRDKVGTVVRLHGAHVLPDANALGAGEAPQWLYTVSFAARAVFGDGTSADALCVDCWESYLDAA
jgi:nitrile hydratase